MIQICHYCSQPEDCRPYGPGGTWVCLDCLQASPERDAAAGEVFNLLLDTAAAMSDVVIVDYDESGPAPLGLAIRQERGTDD